MARPRARTKREDRDRRPKKKISILDQESIEWIDYKDINLLRRFMSERAKIRARRVTGNDAQQQRAVAKAIRVAREMALLPYSVRQVTHRSKGKRGDRDGGTLREFREPPRPGAGDALPAPPEAAGTIDTPEMDVDATTELAPMDANGAVDAPADEVTDAATDEPAEDPS